MAFTDEGFESGNALTAGDTASFTRGAGGALAGSFGLQRNATANSSWKQVWDPSTLVTPGADFVYSGWVRTDTGYATSGLSGLSIVGPAGGVTGYQAVVDVRGTGPTYAIRRATGAGAQGVVVGGSAVNVWTYITMTWVGTTVTAKFYANSSGVPGALLDTATYTDATYTSGYLGVVGYSLSSYDNLHYGVTATPGRSVKVWSGSAWVVKPVKVWSGSAWVVKPVKVYDGSVFR